MITMKDIPREAWAAFDTEMRKRGRDRHKAVVDLLNAWPNAFEYRSTHANYGQCLSLPLTQTREERT